MQRGDAAAAHLYGRRRRRARVVDRARYRERRVALAETAAGPHRERRAALPARPQLPRAGRQHLPRMCRGWGVLDRAGCQCVSCACADTGSWSPAGRQHLRRAC